MRGERDPLPRIGIPLCLERRGERIYQALPRAVSDAVSAAGGRPLLLPVQPQPDALLQELDGLLIPGGGDFTPPAGRYPDSVCFDAILPEQLSFDRALLEGALERALPVLGVCYGMQLIALRHGAALHYDLASDHPGAMEHRGSNAEGHAIRIAEKSELARALGCLELRVNTRHHQAVADTGPQLRVSARAPDGVIEAIEVPGETLCLGVQWHPEHAPSPPERKLFRHFTACCAGRSGSR